MNMRRALMVGTLGLWAVAGCQLDSVLPVADGCESNDDCVSGTCNNGTCGETNGASSSSSSGASSSSGLASSTLNASSGAGGSSGGSFAASTSMGGFSSSLAATSSGLSSSGGAISIGSSSGSGPQVIIHVRATTEPFTHTDSLAGQTPRQHIYGIRALSLYRTAADPAPLLLFDHGNNFVEAPLANGSDTVVGRVAAATLPDDTFTMGRVVLSHIGYHVDAVMHASGNNLPGTFRNLHVFGNNVLLDAQTFQRGDYRYVFSSIAGDFTQQGANGPLPSVSAANGVSLVQEGDEVVLYLPANIVTSPDVQADVNVSFTLNTDKCFRWQDQEVAGNALNVFDTTPGSTEPVLKFGANSYLVTMQ